MANSYLNRTMSTGTSRRIFTISNWVRRSGITSNYPRICAYDQDDNNRFEHFFNNADQLYIEHVSGGSQNIHLVTTRKFRDTSAWYHIVVAVDTTQGTASNRVKLYINGVQETNFTGTVTYPSEDGKTANVVLLNDNINRIPRDLNETSDQQKQFRSSVQLYGRVNNNTATSNVFRTPI